MQDQSTAIVARPCVKCGKKFESYTSANRKYCSDDCTNDSRRKGQWVMCEGKNCDIRFWATPQRLRNGARFHDRRCRNANVAKPRTVKTVCARPGCGVEFEDHASQGRKYHSNECKAIARRKRKTLVCRGCGIEYEKAISVTSAYHSPHCAKEHKERVAKTQAERADVARAELEKQEIVDRIYNVERSANLSDDVDVRSYLLGVFDGEGCITCRYDKRDNRYFLVIGVCMASESITRLFKETWEGSLSPRSKPTVGGLIMWDWRLGFSACEPFLRYVANHGIVKRFQASVALELSENMKKYTWREHSRESGSRMISPEDHELRKRLVTQIRALNGARSRFADQDRLHLP